MSVGRFDVLRQCLVARRSVIADHSWRDRDPEGHLRRLAEVSESITHEHLKLRSARELPVRLDHFLSRASFDKALEFIDAGIPREGDHA